MNKEKEIKNICKLICATCAQFDGCAINCKAHRDTAEALYNAGYRKIDEFAECRNCSAWSGTDCTRHPYTQGCLKDETNVKEQAAEEIALLKSELKKELDEHEAFVNNMKNVLEIEKKNAVREFVEKLKDKFKEFDSKWIVYSKIDELLKEYKNDN